MGPLVYVDRSEVRDGALEELRAAIAELARFVEENEPEIVAYAVYFSQDGREMTVVHVHANAESLEWHMDVAGPEFGKVAHLLTLRSIHVYGEPGARTRTLLDDKARRLGDAEVIVEPLHAGFGRFEAR